MQISIYKKTNYETLMIYDWNHCHLYRIVLLFTEALMRIIAQLTETLKCFVLRMLIRFILLQLADYQIPAVPAVF